MCQKICIVTSCNLKYAPYVKLYTDVLDLAGIKYDLVTWNKYNLDESVTYSYNRKKDDASKFKTFFQYIGFGRFLDKILQRNRYDRLIICNPAPLIFVSNRTLNLYNKRFIWDIRDDTPIRKLFKNRFQKIRHMATCVVTSSRRYEEWIGGPTILSHNAQKDMIQKYYDFEPVEEIKPIISIINAGKMIEDQENIEILKILGNAAEYQFVYYGNDVPGKVALMEYCSEHGIENIEFHGAYNKDEIIDIYRTKGSLINILRANTAINRDALPNKLYEAAIAAVPFVVYEHNSVIVEYAKKYNLGIILCGRDELTSIAERLRTFDYQKYNKGRKAFLDHILSEIDVFEKTVFTFVCGEANKPHEEDSVCS